MSYNKEIESYGYKVLDGVEVIKNNIKFNCKDDLEYKYFIPYNRLKANKKPLPFHASNPHVIDNISNWLKINKPTISIVSDTYIKNNIDMKWKCHIHNFEFNTTWDMISRGCYCPLCLNDKIVLDLTLNQDDVINDFQKIHGDRYDYNKVKYVSAKTPVEIICKTHGSFMMTPDKHKNGQNCKLCSQKEVGLSNKDNQEAVINKFNKVHNYKYNYSKTNYLYSHLKVIVICPYHGEFSITPREHISGRGCRLCMLENRGWTKTKWLNAASAYHKFESFKLYILKCYNENEVFYKIGRTYLTVKKRYREERSMPYQYDIIKIIENYDGNYIYNLENYLHRLHHQNKLKYIPKINFKGKYECFKNILDIDKILLDFNHNICNI